MTERSRSTRMLFRTVSWIGLGFLVFGSIGSVWSVLTFLQVRTAWKASLGGGLASMFFVLIGSAVILLLHPIRAHLAREAGRQPPRWLRWIAGVLVLYALLVFVLATVLAGMPEELEGYAGGLVTYCMLVGVGMLAAAWGFKCASEA